MLSLIAKQILADIQQHLPEANSDFQQKVKGELERALEKAGLVSRQEFDTQAAILERTRAKLRELEAQLEELEKQVTESAQEDKS